MRITQPFSKLPLIFVYKSNEHIRNCCLLKFGSRIENVVYIRLIFLFVYLVSFVLSIISAPVEEVHVVFWYLR